MSILKAAAMAMALLLAPPAWAGAIQGTPGDDTLRPTADMDFVSGGAGTDTLVIAGKLSEVRLTRNSDDSWRIFYPATGSTDIAYSIERIVFSDWIVTAAGLAAPAPANAIDLTRLRTLIGDAGREIARLSPPRN